MGSPIGRPLSPLDVVDDPVTPGAPPVPSTNPLDTLTPDGVLDLEPDRVILTQLSDESKYVEFDYNPEKVSLSRSAELHEKASIQASNNETALKLSGNLLLELHDVRFVGVDLQTRMEQLLAWTQGTPAVAAPAGDDVLPAIPSVPAGGDPGGRSTTMTPNNSPVSTGATGAAGATAAPNLEQLQFFWGKGTNRVVTVKDVNITYTKFGSDGVPLAATVTKITLQCYGPNRPGTNPTSGGLPGRSSHVLVSGESLVGLANSTYGSPRAWRALAEANGLDDPLRLAPGHPIYLPSPRELHQPGAV
jgi:nucleoid-associated protein YgaU